MLRTEIRGHHTQPVPIELVWRVAYGVPDPLLLRRERLEDRESCAGRILEHTESPDVRDVFGPEADRPAKLLRTSDRRVRVLDGDVGQPVRPLAALIRYASAIDAAPGEDVVRASPARQRAVREPEDLLVRRERFRRIATVKP